MTTKAQLKKDITELYKSLKKQENIIYPKTLKQALIPLDPPKEGYHSIIIGKDPYPNDNADGMAFSCAKYVSNSLGVIMKSAEIKVAMTKPLTLEPLHDAGVLLLNTALTSPIKLAQVKGQTHQSEWKETVQKLLTWVFDNNDIKTVYAWGSDAKAFIAEYMEDKSYTPNIVEDKHPSYYGRFNKLMDKSKLQPLIPLLQKCNNITKAT